MQQTRAHPRATHLSLAFRRRALLVIVLLLFSGLSLLDAALAHPVASPNAGAANTERFTGPTFVDVWWDPAAISGCASISLYRDGVEVDTPACGAGLVTDSGLSEGTSYSYQFIVRNDAEPPTTLYLDIWSATPGQVGGRLHRNLSLGGDLTLSGIEVGQDATLALSGATCSGGAVQDWIAAWDGTVREQGTVVVSGGNFDGTSMLLRSAASAISGATMTDAQVSTRTPVDGVNLVRSTVGFEGDDPVALTGSTLEASLVSFGGEAAADIGENTCISSTLSLRGTTIADLYDNTFTTSAVRVWEHASVHIGGNTFLGAVPDPLAFIDVTSDAGITIVGNTLHADSASDLLPTIRIEPAALPASGTSYRVSGNVITGSGTGIGIQARTTAAGAFPALDVADNTVAGFARAIDLSNALGASQAITASVKGNTLTGNGYALLANIRNAASNLTAHNNCIADNSTAGLACADVETVIDATSNYWGHRTGPTHLTNPDGLGDRILCSDAAAEVDFEPWLESHACYVSGLAIAHIEVVQAVQSVSNTLPLVAEKPTVVRVYPDLDAGFAGVDGTLTGVRDGVTLGTLIARSPIAAGRLPDLETARADPTTSLFFDLPQAWLNGVLTLEAEVSTGDSALCASSVDSTGTLETATLTTTVTFQERRPMKIAYIPASIDTLPGYFPVTPKDVLEVHRRIVARLPFGEVPFRIMPAIDRYSDTGGGADGMYYAYIAGVARRWDILNNPGDVADVYITVYGTDSTSYTGSWWWFTSELGGRAGCGLRQEGHDCVMSVANVLGLRPLMIDRESAVPPYDYVFPYLDHRAHEVGYDVVSGEVQSGEVFDLMAPEAVDGAPSWISDFHYTKVYENLGAPPPAVTGAAEDAATADYLYVSGWVGPDDGHFYPVIHLDDSPEPDGLSPVDPAGEACLQARNGMGQVVASTCFHVDLTNPGTGAEDIWGPFTAVLTPDPTIRLLRLLYDGAQVHTMVVPQDPPDVTLVSAAYDPLYQTAVLSWTTPDGSGLRYHMHYSPDNGATWTPIGIDIAPENVQSYDGALHWGVRATQVKPGAQARLRLIATDGFHETVVTSGAFTVPDVGPWLDILTPENNAVVGAFPLVLEGYAYDIEAGDRRASMAWSSSRDGALGTGDRLSVSSLSGGVHIVTLTADDGEGHVAVDTVRITVDAAGGLDSRIFLPLTLRQR